MPKIGLSNKVLQKRIPTLVGIGVLVVGLIAGTILFSQGTGVFSPRATPQTTPKNIRVTNVTDSTFTISFLTDAATKSFVKYGETEAEMSKQALDDRVQLSADNTLSFTLHHITVRGLTADKEYTYVIGSGGAEFDNEGKPFTVKTAMNAGGPPAARTINGVVLNENSSPAVNSVVYVSLPNSGEMSALIRNQSGNWAIPLSDARTKDGKTYAAIADTDLLSIFAQGPAASQIAQYGTTVKEAQPVATITFGQTTTAATTQTREIRVSPTPSPTASAAPNEGSVSKSQTASTSTSKTSTATTSGARGTTQTDILLEDVTDEDPDAPVPTVSPRPSPSPSPQQIAQALVSPSPSPRPSTSPSPRVSPSPTPFSTSNPFPARSSTPSASATPSASPKSTASATTSSLPKSGAVGTTLMLIIGGLFFVIAGTWSFWVGNALSKNEISS